jgi:hypothetical protein
MEFGQGHQIYKQGFALWIGQQGVVFVQRRQQLAFDGRGFGRVAGPSTVQVRWMTASPPE